MKIGIKQVLITTFALIFFAGATGYADDKANYSISPQTNKGRKWRVGYLEGGPFDEYQDTLKAVVSGLAEIGWIEKKEFPTLKDGEDTEYLWGWLAQNIRSDYLEFVADAHYSCNWDDHIRINRRESLLKRLNTQKDLDLVFAMGTWASLDLANADHAVPTISLAVSDPISAKVIPSISDSGFDHFHCRVDPTRYQRQLTLFYDIIGFKKLGVAYEYTPEGKSYAAYSDIEKVAREKGFEIVSCELFNLPDEKVGEMEENAVKCMEALAEKVDAVYITLQSGFTIQNMPQVLAPLNKHRIPSFSQAGSLRVKYGTLLSIAQAGFKYVGRFHAETLAKIFNGAKPGDLEQLFEDPPKIAINLKAAKIIGYDPPVDILGAADEIYFEIQK